MGASRSVHIDQDLDGAPLRTMFRGSLHAFMRAVPALRLLNVWLPLADPPVRPLALMETSHSPARPAVRDKLHFRDWKNDRFYFLHGGNTTQRWWYAPEMRFGSAFVFDATATPHTSFSLPAERCLGERVVRLRVIRHALLHKGVAHTADAHRVCVAVPKRCAALEDGAAHASATPAATASSMGSRMAALLMEADDLMQQACSRFQNSTAHDMERVAALDRKIALYLDSTVRHSIEFRCLVLKISSVGDVAFVAGGSTLILVMIYSAVRFVLRCCACFSAGAKHGCRTKQKIQ